MKKLRHFSSDHQKSVVKQKVEQIRQRMESLPADQAAAWDSLWKEK
jgi:hypothetical protein